MSEEELVRAFESCELDGDAFPHASHIRVAWWYLNHDPLLIALSRFRTALQHFAAAKGKPDRYHETITVAYMLLIAERLADARGLPWTEFADRHPDLLSWNPSILSRYYTDDTLSSDRARHMFVMPDRTSLSFTG